MRSSRLASWVGLSTGLCTMVIVGAASAQVDVPAAAKAGSSRGTRGTGLCGHMIKVEGVPFFSLLEAIDLLDGKPAGNAKQAAPPGDNNHSSAFYGVLQLLDYSDAEGNPNGRWFFENRFPWTTGNGGICTSQQQGQPSPVTSAQLALRARGFIDITTPGIKTFALGADDIGFLAIAGIPLVIKDVGSSITYSTGRARFAEAGLYPIEIVYGESGGAAALEVAIADEELVFLDNNGLSPVPPGTAGAGDLVGAGGLFENFFKLAGDSDGLQLFVADADAADPTRCGATVGRGSDICALPGNASCGNGSIDQRSDGSDEACDDGNTVDGDGCSAACVVEPGFACNGVPSRCDNDPDGDDIGSKREQLLGLSALSSDTDGDGLLDGEENPDGAVRDTDGDGKQNGADDDDDGDQLTTLVERNATNTSGVSDDVDGDGAANWLDTDADGDGVEDAVEGLLDEDGDGIPSFLDPTFDPPPGGAGGISGQGGAGQAGQGGAGQAGQGGAGQAGQGGAGQAGQNGAGQAGQNGAGQAGQNGAGQAGQSGAAQAGQSGAAQAGQSGAAQAGQSGAAQAGQSGAAQAGQGGAAQAGQGGAGPAGQGGAGRAGASGRGDVGLGSGAQGGQSNGNGVGTGTGSDDSDGGCAVGPGRSSVASLGWGLVLALLVRRRRALAR